jgi:photosystem II stability/assembly factor-like uncharacterized protein
MEPTDAQSADVPRAQPGRTRRALSLIALSIGVIALTGIGYLRPSLVFGTAQSRQTPGPQTGYQLSAVDFVSPTEGWFVATFDSGRYALLHTKDAGRHWERQLAGATGQRAIYVDFFDPHNGVFGLVGAQSLLLRTADGGRSWSSKPAVNASAYVLAATFVDPDHGWLLVRSSARVAAPPELFRTQDGGADWSDLGSPVKGADQAYQVHFTNGSEGWLDSISTRPYAYRSDDAGATWRQVSLPAPAGGWPASAQFFVTAQPTEGVGVIVTVASFTPTVGRTGIGERVVAYPPLTVKAYDGGVPVSYTYLTLVDAIPKLGLWAAATQHRNGSSQVQAPNQVQLGSLDGGLTWTVIAPPDGPGAIGYSDAADWWWIGSGAWATSSDGGTTWTPYRNVGVPQPIAGSLQVLDADHAWFGAMAGTTALLETTDDRGIHWEMVGLPPVNPD